MYLKPKRTKYAKAHKGRVNFIPKLKSKSLKFTAGNFALVALAPYRVKASQLYAAELSIKRHLKKKGQIYLRVFPQTPVSKKPLQVRMGKGKGSVDHWVARVQKGTIILELKCANSLLAKKALTIASSKLPLPTQITGLNLD